MKAEASWVDILLFIFWTFVFAASLVTFVHIAASEATRDWAEMKLSCYLAGETSRKCHSLEYIFYGEYR